MAKLNTVYASETSVKRVTRITASVLIAALILTLSAGCMKSRTIPNEEMAADNTANESAMQADTESPQAEDGHLTIIFDASGGECDISQKEVTHQQAYGDLPMPVLSGSDFDGWYTAQKDGEKIGESTIVTATKDHTLYAHWTLKGNTYLADLILYEWKGDGDHAFSVLSKPETEIKDTHGASFWRGAVGLERGYGDGEVNLSVAPATVTYDINKEYKTLSGYWGPLEDEGDRSFWVEIYGDDTLLYTTPEQKEGSATIPFSVDVSGVKYLIFSIKSSAVSFVDNDSRNDYAIFDPTLTR